MSATSAKNFITGEQFGEERRRLILAGKNDDSPEGQALWNRVIERDTYLWDKYAPALMEEHRGKWAAISLDGQVVIRPTAVEAMGEAEKRFGASNFALGKLAAFPGYDLRRW